jgi:response regulator NasT
MFVDRSSPGLAEAAVEAGVAAYVVNGLSAGRVRSVLEVAMTRFELMQKLRSDLDKAKADLASRKSVERAKGLLMKERGMDGLRPTPCCASWPWTPGVRWARWRRTS